MKKPNIAHYDCSEVYKKDKEKYLQELMQASYDFVVRMRNKGYSYKDMMLAVNMAIKELNK